MGKRWGWANCVPDYNLIPSWASLRLSSETSIARRAASPTQEDDGYGTKKRIVVIGAGWGGLSTAYALSKHDDFEVTVVEASPRVGVSNL